MLRIPARVAPQIAGRAREVCYATVDREIREALTLLAEQGYQLRAGVDLEGDAA